MNSSTVRVGLITLAALFTPFAGASSAQIIKVTASGPIHTFYDALALNPTVNIGTMIHFSAKLDLSKAPHATGSDASGGYGLWKPFDTQYSYGNVSATAPLDQQRYMSSKVGFSESYTFVASDPDFPYSSGGLRINLPNGSVTNFDTPLDLDLLLQHGPFGELTGSESNYHPTGGGYSYYAYADITQFSVERIDFTPVPEPSTYGAFAVIGLIGIVAVRRYRRRNS